MPALKIPRLAIMIALAGYAGAAKCDSTADPTLDIPLVNFDRVLDLEETATTSANASIGDLDGDGNLDIVLVKGRHWPVIDRLLFGDGKGHFDRAADLGVSADRSYTGALADVDRDGDLDILVSNDKPDRKLVYLNDGRGEFSVSSTFGQPHWATRNISLADMNKDSLPDIVVANRSSKGSSLNYICLNLGDGRFQTDCLAFSEESATTITPYDMDGDGLVDLVVPHRDGGQSQVYLRQSGEEIRFETKPFGPSDAAIRATQVADFNLDGALDIVAIHTGRGDTRRGVAVYFGRGDGEFSEGFPIADSSRKPYALSTADLNLDGAADIVVGHVEAPTTVFLNRRNGEQFHVMDIGDDEGAAYGFAIADLDGDGQPDIVAARSGARNQLFFGARVETN